MKNKNWKLLSRKEMYDGSPYIKVYLDKIELPDGKIIDDYHRIEVNDAVMLLVENDKNELLVYNEYRHGIGKLSYTFPAGAIEKDESLEECCKRELLEEMGYNFNSWKLLKKYTISGSYRFSELNIIFIRDIEKITSPKCVDIEKPEPMWLNRFQVEEAIKNNKFIGMTYVTTALLWLFYNEKK